MLLILAALDLELVVRPHRPAHGTGGVVIGSPSLARQLAIWMNGEWVGEWRLPARGPQEFVYEPG